MLFVFSMNFLVGLKLVMILSGVFFCIMVFFCVLMCQCWCFCVWIRNMLQELKCGLMLLLLLVQEIIRLFSCVFGMKWKCERRLWVVGRCRLSFCMSSVQVGWENGGSLLSGFCFMIQWLLKVVMRCDFMFLFVVSCVSLVCVVGGIRLGSVWCMIRGFFCQCWCMNCLVVRLLSRVRGLLICMGLLFV